MAQQEVPWDEVATSAARWTEYARLGIPLWSLVPVFGVPFLLTVVTFNGWWLFGWLVTPWIARGIFGEDQNRPRIKWLCFRSGQMFANREPWGGDSRDPLDV